MASSVFVLLTSVCAGVVISRGMQPCRIGVLYGFANELERILHALSTEVEVLAPMIMGKRTMVGVWGPS